MIPALASIGGLAVGSFLNVLIARLPRGESLIKPRSHCPNCGTAIRPYDNVPIFSWLMLRARCRSCHRHISVRYPLVEAVTALLALTVALTKHSAGDVALGLALIGVLVPVTLIDLDHRIIPNKITGPAAILALALGLALKPSGVPEQLIAGAAAGGFLLVFVLAYPRGMGMGDVKLAGVLGLYLGRSVAPAMMVAVIAATVAGTLVMARKGVKDGRKTAMPFGPFLALGGIVGLLAGPAILHWYLHAAG